jgi:hypothetical protein
MSQTKVWFRSPKGQCLVKPVCRWLDTSIKPNELPCTLPWAQDIHRHSCFLCLHTLSNKGRNRKPSTLNRWTGQNDEGNCQESIMQGNCHNPRNDAILCFGLLPLKKTPAPFFCPNEIRFSVWTRINIKLARPGVSQPRKLLTFHNPRHSVFSYVKNKR